MITSRNTKLPARLRRRPGILILLLPGPHAVFAGLAVAGDTVCAMGDCSGGRRQAFQVPRYSLSTTHSEQASGALMRCDSQILSLESCPKSPCSHSVKVRTPPPALSLLAWWTARILTDGQESCILPLTYGAVPSGKFVGQGRDANVSLPLAYAIL